MVALVLLLLAILGPAVMGIFMVRSMDQRRHDNDRRTYRLTFPSELDEAAVTSWIRSVSGTLRMSAMRLSGAPTLAFELWATSQGLVHRLKIPWQHADYVISQLRSLVPGIRLTPESEWPKRQWTRAVEVGLTHSGRPLRIYSAPDVAASLLASVQALHGDETVLVQWVVTPAMPQHLPVHREAHTDTFTARSLVNGTMANRDEIHARREKLSEPNVMAVLRLGATASTPKRADHLIYRVRASLASVRSPSSRFVRRLATAKQLQARLENASGAVNFPAQLSAPELAALVAWPIGNPFVTGLPPRMARQLPASDLVPVVGRVVGRSNFPGNERPIATNYVAALKHTHVIGPTGAGKTVLLANMMKQDMDAGHGVVLIDAKGGSSSLFAAALNYVPRDRIKDAVVLDVTDVGHPLGFNIMNQGSSRVVIDELTELFESMYDSKSVWTREVLYHGLRTIASDPRLTFIDLAALLLPQSGDDLAWRDNLVRNLADDELRQFWQRFENQPRAAQDRITQPVMDRIWQLNARPELRNIIGQSTSSFQMDEIVARGKILLVNLGGLSQDTASLTGTLLMNALWDAVKRTPSEPPVYLYLDEFQKFIKLPIDPESMLAEARGLGLGMTLAHQHLNQLPTELRQAVLANARTKIVFQTTADDARQMSREFGSSLSDGDFMHLGKYEAVARIATGDGVSSPLTMTTIEPARGTGVADVVRAHSRTVYGRPVADVVREMAARRRVETASKPNRPRPRISGWD